MVRPPFPLLASDAVRFVGDAVAFVVAETLVQAKDAAELVDVSYDALPAVAYLADASRTGAPAVWPQAPDNVAFDFDLGDRATVDSAFAQADHIATLDFTINRVSAAPMEPRAAVGLYDPNEERYTLYSGTQNPHTIRRLLATSLLKIPEIKLRVVSPDMGGAFGMRSSPYRELTLVLWAARVVGRPVKWVSERSEAFISDDQARDNLTRVELALRRDGTFLALRATTRAALGAYLALGAGGPPTMNVGGIAGVYKTPAIHVHVEGYFSHTPPTSAYRGAGRPEASYAIERVIELAARELGIDPYELRRRNTIPPSSMPFQTGLVFKYDSGEFERNLDMALRLSDASSFAARRQQSRSVGRLRGFGIANVIERAASIGEETAEIRFDPTGGVTLLMGTHSHGQGHETVFRQLLADMLALDFENVRFVQGDTDQVGHGFGTFGSRSSGLASAAIRLAADKIVAKCRKIVAHQFETSESDIEFADGRFTVAGTDKTRTLQEVVRIAYSAVQLPPTIEVGLHERAAYAPKAATFPNGCHTCELEIDPETGGIRILRYCVVDDVGTVMNPLLLEGQIHGGIVQGAGQVLMEDIAWDPSSGQALAGSFMDYAMPRAADFPSFEIDVNPVPTPSNPLGIKGAGEAGTIGALPCVMNAIIDALAPLGVRTIDMPATPERVWRAIKGATR
jgi:carbon-monoxide dehydrogenase large subunit